MKKLFLFVLSFAFTASLFAQNDRKNLNVTIYNNDLGVVNETRSIFFEKGISTVKIEDVAEHIDPTSVHIELPGNVLEQNYQYDLVNLLKILQKYINKNVQLTSKEGKFIEGKLLSVNGNQIVLQKTDGGLLLLPKIDEYQLSVGALPDGLITKPALVWKVQSQKGGTADAGISYQTSGMSWHAEYVAVLNDNDTKMDLNSWVSIENNSGATYPDANLKLIAGNVNRVNEPVNYNIRGSRYPQADEIMVQKQFDEKSFFEYHIYNLQNKTTLANNEVKQISLFEAGDIPIRKKYLLRTSHYLNEKQKVAVVVEFENKTANHLGIPMPKGKVRLYKSDGNSKEFVGEDLIDHTPKDEKLKLKVGDAFDIVAEQKPPDEKKIADRVYEYTYSFILKNRKDSAVEIEVEHNAGNFWEVLDSNIKWEKKDAQNILFKVPVKPGEEKELSFRIRFSY